MKNEELNLEARIAGKKTVMQLNAKNINYYNNIINKCKKDIENGKDVEGNKETIIELQDAIRYFQKQIDAANQDINKIKWSD